MSAAAGDALAAIDLVAKAGMSLTIGGRSGPAIDALLARLAVERGVLRLAASADVATLAGGPDALATIAAGRMVRRASLVERLGGRVLVVAGAQRIEPSLAALLAGWIDDGALAGGLVLLDEGEADEAVPAALADRMAMRVDADALTWRDLAQSAHPPHSVRAELVEARDPDDALWDTPFDKLGTNGGGDASALLVETAAALGIDSARAPLLALAVSRAANGDLALATRLVLAARARIVPPPPPEREDEAKRDAEAAAEHGGDAQRLIEAARAVLPAGLLNQAAATASGAGPSGSAPARRGSAARGRLGRVRHERPGRSGRLDLVATLIAAAPMQAARGRRPGEPPRIRRDDLRVRERQPRQRHATVIAVDASGSAAMARLGEVKGAIEQLLADSYVRRDEVALVAFRGTGAETLLPPTRSLARVRRELAALPGGGATPLAGGIAAGLEQAVRSRAAGRAVLFVLLTDGGANIARDGSADRLAAARDAEAAARQVAALGIAALVIDASPRGAPSARAIAAAMDARYLALPRADDAALAGAMRAAR